MYFRLGKLCQIKSKLEQFSYSSSKWITEQQRQLATWIMITWTANEHTVQWWFKKFCREDKSVEGEVHSRPPSEADNNQLTTTWEVAQELTINLSTVIWHLKQIGKVKELDKWVSCELTTNQKNHLEVFSYHMQQQGTISPLDYDVWRKVDFIQQPVMTSSVLGPRRNSKALLKAKLAPKEGSWSLFGGLLLVWSTTGFWIPVKPLYLRSTLSTSMRCTENCNIYNQHESTERAQFSPKPRCIQYNQHFKTWMDWATKFCLICYMHLISCQLTTTSSSISTTFCRGKCFHNQ